ncbi:MAG: hypothetical protein OER92_04660 [Alphaproteobacteria bacterium]|nr:hypothetical protein [Alphaproteobacteria bacterium]
MNSKSFIAVCFSDLAGQVRGHGVPRVGIHQLYKRGLPWPADLANLTVFGEPIETPWHTNGGLRVLPDAAAEVTIDFGGEAQQESFVLGSILTGDEENWGGCTRSFLQTTLDVFKGEFGFDVACTYEHQFSLHGPDQVGMPAMSLSALRRERQFASALATVLENAGITLVRFGAGVGDSQFTATTQAKFGVSAADSVVIFRQLVHATAEQLGQRCSFAPGSPASGQNRLILGLDLFDDGDQVTYDSTSPNGVSATLGGFVAGMQRHLASLSALTRPTIVPPTNGHSNSGGTITAAQDPRWHNRPIVINPALSAAAAREYSVAFTAADATACPYLQLGAIMCAGILGLREALPFPEDEILTSPDAGTKNGAKVGSLPDSLSDALTALGQDDVFRGVFPDGLLQAYTDVKQAELATVSRLSPEELGAWSQQIY